MVLGRDLTEEGLMLNINFYLVERTAEFLNFDIEYEYVRLVERLKTIDGWL